MIVIKIAELLSLLYCIKYIFDRLNDKIEDIGIDHIAVILIITLIMLLIFV